MSRQLHTLYNLNNALTNLDWAQFMINSARETVGDHQELQLFFDRQQTLLDERRKCILTTYYVIASSN